MACSTKVLNVDPVPTAFAPWSFAFTTLVGNKAGSVRFALEDAVRIVHLSFVAGNEALALALSIFRLARKTNYKSSYAEFAVIGQV